MYELVGTVAFLSMGIWIDIGTGIEVFIRYSNGTGIAGVLVLELVSVLVLVLILILVRVLVSV
jgi:hypothetical protein